MRRRLSSPHRFAAVFTRGLLRLSLLTTVLFGVLAFGLLGQEVVSNSSVIKMVKAGLSEDLILNVIKQQSSSFVIGSNELVELKMSGVSERIITAMFTKTYGAAPPAPAKPEAAKPKPPPQERGVYYKKGDGWTELLFEQIVWSDAGVAKNVRKVASVGLLRGDVSGVVKQPSSRTMLNSSPEIVIIQEEGENIHNVLLVPLKRTKKGNRTVEIGAVKNGEVNKRAIPFGVEKVGKNQFKMVFQAPLGPGEYGILPLNQITTYTGTNPASGRLNTFSVLP